MDVTTKNVEAMVSPVQDSTHPSGEFDVILSTEALDRDGERLYLDEWKTPLPDHITIDSDHDMSVVSTVGSGKPFINDQNQLQVRGTFASTPHAQNVRTLVNEGHIKTVSVAFRVDRGRKDSKPQRELLNAGFVAVPANPEAVVLSSKTVKNDAAPMTQQQSIHDAAVSLGAMCGDYKSASEAETKALADDELVDPTRVLAGIDAILDQAQALVVDVDRAALPPEVTQALDMLFGVGPAVDELMEAMGIYDPDDSETEETSGSAGTVEPVMETAAAAKAAATVDIADATALRARSLAFLVTKTTQL
jgi:HK97 family phage prohead protease